MYLLGCIFGISPGLLFALLVHSTTRRGRRVGILVALTPLFSDVPLIVGGILLLSHLPAQGLPFLTIVGGLFLMALGFQGSHALLLSSLPSFLR